MFTNQQAGSRKSVRELVRQLCENILPTNDREIQRQALHKSFDTLIFPYDVLLAEHGARSNSIAIDAFCFSMSCAGHQTQAVQLEALVSSFAESDSILLPIDSASRSATMLLQRNSEVIKTLLSLATEGRAQSATVFLSTCMDANDLAQVEFRAQNARQIPQDDTSVESGHPSFVMYPNKDFSAVGAVHGVSLDSHPSVDHKFGREPCATQLPGRTAGDLFGAVSHGAAAGAANTLDALLSLPLLSENETGIDLLLRAQTARIAASRSVAPAAAEAAPESIASPWLQVGAEDDGAADGSLDSSALSSEATLDAWGDMGSGSAAAESAANAEAGSGGGRGRQGRWWEETRLGASFAASLPLSERGAEAAEAAMRRLGEGVSDEYAEAALMPEPLLVADAIYLLLGLGSRCFEYDGGTGLRVRRRVRVERCGASVVGSLLEELCEAGGRVRRLEAFAQQHRTGKGKVLGALCEGIDEYLQEYRQHVLSLRADVARRRAEEAAAEGAGALQQRGESREIWADVGRCQAVEEGAGSRDKVGRGEAAGPTLLEVAAHTHAVRAQLLSLARVARCEAQPADAAAAGKEAEAEGGMQLLSRLCREVEGAEGASGALLRRFLARALEPFLATLHSAVFFAEVEDPHGEFVLTLDAEAAADEARSYREAWALATEERCPDFLVPVRGLLLRTMQGLSVLRRARPAHPVSSAVTAPPLQLAFTPQRVRRRLGRHRRHQAEVQQAVEAAAAAQAREVRERQRRERREFAERVRGLMEQYRALEAQERRARGLARERRAARGRELGEQVAQRREEAAREAAREAAEERAVVAEQDLYGAASAEELARVKAAAAERVREEYAGRLQRLREERRAISWPARRRALHEKRVALLIDDLQRMRDQMLQLMTDGPETADDRQPGNGAGVEGARGEDRAAAGTGGERGEVAMAGGEAGEGAEDGDVVGDGDTMGGAGGPGDVPATADGEHDESVSAATAEAQEPAVTDSALDAQRSASGLEGGPEAGHGGGGAAARLTLEERETMRLAGMVVDRTATTVPAATTASAAKAKDELGVEGVPGPDGRTEEQARGEGTDGAEGEGASASRAETSDGAHAEEVGRVETAHAREEGEGEGAERAPRARTGAVAAEDAGSLPAGPARQGGAQPTTLEEREMMRLAGMLPPPPPPRHTETSSTATSAADRLAQSPPARPSLPTVAPDPPAAAASSFSASPTPSQVASPTPSLLASGGSRVSWSGEGGGGLAELESPLGAETRGRSPYSREPTASPWLRRAAAAIQETEGLCARLMSEEPLGEELAGSGEEDGAAPAEEGPVAALEGVGGLSSELDLTAELFADDDEEEEASGVGRDEEEDELADDSSASEGESEDGWCAEETWTESDVEQKVLPLSVAVDQCVLQPLVLQYRQVSGAAVDLLLDELRLEHHLRALRRYMFAEEGNWADILARRIFAEGAGLQRGAGRHAQVLQEALAETRRDADPFAQHLSLDAGAAGQPGALGREGGGEGVRLSYHVEWPLSIVLHPASLRQYQRVLGFLVEMRRAVNCLDTAWVDLKAKRGTASSGVLAACHSIRHHMLHFCTVIQGYLLSQLLHTSWQELQDSLRGRRRPADLQELVERHDAYIAAVIDKALLSPRTSSVLEIVRAALGTVVAFGGTLSRLAEAPVHQQPALLAQVRESKAAFEGYAGFLFKVVYLMLQKGRSKQQHLEELLLRLDFNGYYAQNMSVLSTNV